MSVHCAADSTLPLGPRRVPPRVVGSSDHAPSTAANAVAYQLYLRGRFHWNQRSAADFRKAITFFEQAIASDPAYALAYSGLADCYSLLPIYDRRTSAREMTPQARQAVLKALSMDDTLAEAHASLSPAISASLPQRPPSACPARSTASWSRRPPSPG